MRGLRYHLSKTFDKIYILDLHGNSKKKEICPDASPDQNVFDIMQGVSINIFIKTGKKKSSELSQVFHADCYGNRASKYDFLSKNSFADIDFKKVKLSADNYLFVPRDNKLETEYNTFFCVSDLFIKNSTGIISSRDNMVIDTDVDKIIDRVNYFRTSSLDNKKLCDSLKISLKNGWDIDKARLVNSTIENPKELIKTLNYRPFDLRFIYYEDNLVWTTARPIMKNFDFSDNFGLVVGKKGQVVGSMQWNLAFITKDITDFNMFYRGGINMFPLYLCTTKKEQELNFENKTRIPNFNNDVISEFSRSVNLKFVDEKSIEKKCFCPLDVLHYMYAILHSSNFRDRFKDFLKIDFPRIPYPTDAENFWKLVELGTELREIHLLESPKVNDFITEYHGEGDNLVVKPVYKDGSVYINTAQHFTNVPETTWNFYIGGYQPAQKWLKDRKDRELSFEDILHYQKIIVALTETGRIMGEIDLVTSFGGEKVDFE